MEALKLLTRRSLSRAFLFSRRKYSDATSGCLYNQFQSVNKSTNRSIRIQPVASPGIRMAWYSQDSPSKDGKDASKKSEPDSSSSSSDSSDETSTDDEGESSSSDEVAPSQSQTGEPLPSEVDQWDSKTDKLYKQIELEVLAYEPSVLDSYQWFVLTTASHLGIKVGKLFTPLRPNKMRFPLLKSAFVHKKHQVQYEVRTHHRFIILHKLTSSTADTFLEYIERNLPEGVGLKVTKVEAKALPHYLQKSQAEQAAAQPPTT